MKRSSFVLLLICLVLSCVLVEARSVNGSRVAVMLDSLDDKSIYSSLWRSLEEREFTLTFDSVAAPKLQLLERGIRNSDHLILLTSSKNLKGAMSVANIINYINDGGNVLFAVDNKITDSHRELAYEWGVEFDDNDSSVIDQFHHYTGRINGKSTDATYILTDKHLTSNAIISAATRTVGPVLFQGIAHKMIFTNNPLVKTILHGERTAITGELGQRSSKSSFATGSDVGLVSVLQAKNNARVVIAGSKQLFSDEFFNVKGSDGKTINNAAFVEELSRWVFQEKSVLRVVNTHHSKVGSIVQQKHYRIKDTIVYNVTLQEWIGTRWVPYIAKDLQIEAVMLDSYLRQTMTVSSVTSAAAIYFAQLNLPDVYGVFNFKVDYQRVGRTWITTSELISIHPFRHNEYPRFIPVAYPYYTAIFSQMTAFVIFSFFWLTNKDSLLAIPRGVATTSTTIQRITPVTVSSSTKRMPVVTSTTTAAIVSNSASNEDDSDDEGELSQAIATAAAIATAVRGNNDNSPGKRATQSVMREESSDVEIHSKAKQRRKKGGK